MRIPGTTIATHGVGGCGSDCGCGGKKRGSCGCGGEGKKTGTCGGNSESKVRAFGAPGGSHALSASSGGFSRTGMGHYGGGWTTSDDPDDPDNPDTPLVQTERGDFELPKCTHYYSTRGCGFTPGTFGSDNLCNTGSCKSSCIATKEVVNPYLIICGCSCPPSGGTTTGGGGGGGEDDGGHCLLEVKCAGIPWTRGYAVHCSIVTKDCLGNYNRYEVHQNKRGVGETTKPFVGTHVMVRKSAPRSGPDPKPRWWDENVGGTASYVAYSTKYPCKKKPGPGNEGNPCKCMAAEVNNYPKKYQDKYLATPELPLIVDDSALYKHGNSNTFAVGMYLKCVSSSNEVTDPSTGKKSKVFPRGAIGAQTAFGQKNTVFANVRKKY